MIMRFWRGWTAPANADSYEALLRGEIFPGIRERAGDALQDITLLRRNHGAEVEFVTLLAFTSLEAVKAMTGEDYEKAYVPDPARKLLARFDEKARHYEVKGTDR